MFVYYVNEMTWDQLGKVDRDKAICILPVGSLEQHGKHMPLGTDDLILENSLMNLNSIENNQDNTVLIYPHIKYGSSVEHMHFPGTVSLKVTTLIAVVEDIIASIVNSGMKNIVFVNSHGGNTSILQSMAQEFRYKYDIRIFNIDYWATDYFSFAEDIIEAKLVEECHAGEIETSLLMHWTPDLVRLENATEKELNEVAEFYKYDFSWLSNDLSESGVLGNALKSTPEKGHLLAEKMEKKLVAILEQIAVLTS